MKDMTITHVGILSGDARAGGRKMRVKMRLTPSGSHWVTEGKKKFPRRGGGQTGSKWPMWFLDASSIQEITAQGIETAQPPRRETGLARKGDGGNDGA